MEINAIVLNLLSFRFSYGRVLLNYRYDEAAKELLRWVFCNGRRLSSFRIVPNSVSFLSAVFILFPFVVMSRRVLGF